MFYIRGRDDLGQTAEEGPGNGGRMLQTSSALADRMETG